jgi:hypothetical protein
LTYPTGFKNSKVLLKSDATGNKIKVSKNYPLQEYDEKKVNSESKTLINVSNVYVVVKIYLK